MNEELERLFYSLDQPSAYAGGYRIANAAKNKYSRREISEWLAEQDTYTQHKPTRRRYQQRTYTTRNINDTYEIDLADFRSLKAYNDGFSYLLVAIDTLSKYAFAEAIKDKTATSVAHGFKKILQREPMRVPIVVQSDKGLEFLAGTFQKLLKKYNIKYRTISNPDSKCACVERFIRTLKGRIYRYFTHKNTRRYVDVIQDIVKCYNNSIHSGIRMKPACVTLYNASEARKNLADKYEKIPERVKKPKFHVGDLVRISRGQRVFRKSYEGGWTIELFKIVRISTSRYPFIYFLHDLANDPIEGFFYEQELCLVRKALGTVEFEIDEILESTGTGAAKKYLVSWRGYPAKFNSYVSAKDLQEI